MSCCSSFCRSITVMVLTSVRYSPSGVLVSPAPPPVPEGPGESSPAHREVVTLGRGVQVRSPAGCGALRIGYDGRLAVRVRAGGHPQQLALRGPLPAPDAGPDRTRGDRGVRAGGGACVRAPLSTTLPRTAPRIPNRAPAEPRVRGRSGVRLSAPRRSGCRCASRSGGRRGGRSGPPCRSPARAGSRGRRPGRTGPRASMISTELTRAGESACATSSAGSSDQSTMSIFSPCSSDITSRTR